MAGNKNSGRKPQPTALRILRGNPGKRPLNRAEPAPPAVTAEFDTPPLELEGDPLAQTEWRRLAPILRGCKLVTEAERTALVALCQVWSHMLTAQAAIRKVGMLLSTDSGPKANPAIAVYNAALSQIRPLWEQLGLTPAGRARIYALPGKDEPERSKWDGLLSAVGTDTRTR
jgi:P27 family predicted phage terminase small subunit